MRVLKSNSLDVFENLATEELLLEDFETEGPALLLYRDRPSLVWGKNQNPWSECAVPDARRAGVRTARRLSGGGTVYHDEGNLNYTLILPRPSYTREKVLDRVVDALRGLGLPARREGTSLFVHGDKFSGSAFCFRGAAVLHHGTLLVESDLARLGRLLRPCLTGIETKAVASAPASVMNLADAGVHVEQLELALVATFAPGQAVAEVAAAERRRAREITDRLASWEWAFGLTPRFEVTLVDDPAMPGRLRVVVEEGRIAGVQGQERGRDLPGNLLERLPFDSSLLGQRLALDGFSGLGEAVTALSF